MPQEKLQNYKKYLELKNYQPSTIRSLLRTAEKYQKQETEAQELRTSTLRLYYYQKKTYLKYLEEIESEKHYLKEEHYKKQITKIQILTLEQIKQLEQNCTTLRDQVILHCLYSLGLRLSEVANLELEDLDLTNNLVLIKKTKTKKQRQVPIPNKTQEALNHYIQNQRPVDKGKKLLQGLKGDLTPDGIYQQLKKIAKRTSLKKRIYPHLLRHSIASHLLSQGMDLEYISKYLGHNSISSTEIYTHISKI